ncbi:unnamed protein product, partial [Amoebophrya sp. A120]|eukprot:GSA120T00023407001.1
MLGESSTSHRPHNLQAGGSSGSRSGMNYNSSGNKNGRQHQPASFQRLSVYAKDLLDTSGQSVDELFRKYGNYDQSAGAGVVSSYYTSAARFGRRRERNPVRAALMENSLRDHRHLHLLKPLAKWDSLFFGGEQDDELQHAGSGGAPAGLFGAAGVAAALSTRALKSTGAGSTLGAGATTDVKSPNRGGTSGAAAGNSKDVGDSTLHLDAGTTKMTQMDYQLEKQRIVDTAKMQSTHRFREELGDSLVRNFRPDKGQKGFYGHLGAVPIDDAAVGSKMKSEAKDSPLFKGLKAPLDLEYYQQHNKTPRSFPLNAWTTPVWFQQFLNVPEFRDAILTLDRSGENTSRLITAMLEFLAE